MVLWVEGPKPQGLFSIEILQVGACCRGMERLRDGGLCQLLKFIFERRTLSLSAGLRNVTAFSTLEGPGGN